MAIPSGGVPFTTTRVSPDFIPHARKGSHGLFTLPILNVLPYSAAPEPTPTSPKDATEMTLSKQLVAVVGKAGAALVQNAKTVEKTLEKRVEEAPSSVTTSAAEGTAAAVAKKTASTTLGKAMGKAVATATLGSLASAKSDRTQDNHLSGKDPKKVVNKGTSLLTRALKKCGHVPMSVAGSVGGSTALFVVLDAAEKTVEIGLMRAFLPPDQKEVPGVIKGASFAASVIPACMAEVAVKGPFATGKTLIIAKDMTNAEAIRTLGKRFSEGGIRRIYPGYMLDVTKSSAFNLVFWPTRAATAAILQAGADAVIGKPEKGSGPEAALAVAIAGPSGIAGGALAAAVTYPIHVTTRLQKLDPTLSSAEAARQALTKADGDYVQAFFPKKAVIEAMKGFAIRGVVISLAVAGVDVITQKKDTDQ